MSETTYSKIAFVAMIVLLFAKKHHRTEAVIYQYISRYGGDRLLIDNYADLHTCDFAQVVDDLGDYCRRKGGTL
ncbi:MAG: DUF3791 domain-containing protein [Bacteroidales bacterium]|nr:DUF3791 domain-containing protein [Bacteroidales bacterium]